MNEPSKRIKEYTLVKTLLVNENSPPGDRQNHDFMGVHIDSVNSMIKHGWQPLGSPFICQGECVGVIIIPSITQAMVKYASDKMPYEYDDPHFK